MSDARIDLYEDELGGLWFVPSEGGLAIVARASGGFLADARLYLDLWGPADRPEDVYWREGIQPLLDAPGTLHVASWREGPDQLDLLATPRSAAGRRYLLDGVDP